MNATAKLATLLSDVRSVAEDAEIVKNSYWKLSNYALNMNPMRD